MKKNWIFCNPRFPHDDDDKCGRVMRGMGGRGVMRGRGGRRVIMRKGGYEGDGGGRESVTRRNLWLYGSITV